MRAHRSVLPLATLLCLVLASACTPHIRDRTAAAMDRMVTMWSGEPPPPGWELELPGSVLRHNGEFGPLNPYLVVRVDNEIVSAHNQIHRPRFIDFLRYFIALTTAPRGEEASAP